MLLLISKTVNSFIVTNETIQWKAYIIFSPPLLLIPSNYGNFHALVPVLTPFSPCSCKHLQHMQVTFCPGLPMKILVYSCFSSIMINNASFLLRSIQIWMINYIVTLFQGICLFIFNLPVAIIIMLGIW